MLSSFTIENFKSYREATLKLAPTASPDRTQTSTTAP